MGRPGFRQIPAESRGLGIGLVQAIARSIHDQNGNRFLMMDNGMLVPLAADGLSIAGPAKKVYEGWTYPEEWDVEGFCLEGPKIKKIGKYYYMLSAEGGTAGPPTSHMVVVARSENLSGPWENSPYNPLIHT